MNCVRYNSFNYTFKNSSDLYQGISLNILINVISYILLILIFILLRKNAWNYGAIKWLKKPVNLVPVAEDISDMDSSEQCIESNSDNRALQPNTIWRWIPLFIRMNDKCLKKKCGFDAVIYCMFQRMLIIISIIMTILCLSIILPLNFSGNLLSNYSSSFKTLTIANIEVGSAKLAFHLSISFVLMIFVFFISNWFLTFVDTKTHKKTGVTLMVTNIPTGVFDEQLIEQHFKEAYPTISNIRVQKTYAIGKLFDLYTNKVLAEEALEYCVSEYERFDRRVKVASNAFGRMCMSCSCCMAKCQPIDGIEYYTEEVKRCTQFFLKEQKLVFDSGKLPIVFVSFDSIQHAILIRREYIYQNYCCIKQYPKSQSSLSERLKSNSWHVIFAPIPKDILWENLHKRGFLFWLKIIFINLFVVFLVITLSTPPIILQIWNKYFQNKVANLWKWISQFFPSLIMVIVTSIMPLLVCWANDMSAHWTRTKQNIAIMNKLFTVLVLTVLILPSLGLTSVHQILWSFFNQNESFSNLFKWECIFLADGGAIFCNYLISAGFIGMGLEILRFGQLFLIIFKLSWSRSKAEDNGIVQSLCWEFPYGINYAWTLAMFSIISTYAVIVPLITPFGLFYLISKYLVDRYSMIYVNIPALVENDVHFNAVKLLQICLIFTQATVTIYVSFRAKGFSIILGLCVMALCLGIILAIGRSVKRSILSMAWMKYNDISHITDQSGVSHDSRSVTDNVEVSLDDDNMSVGSFVPIQIKPNKQEHFVEKMQNRLAAISSSYHLIN